MYTDTTKEDIIQEILDDAIECKVITESDKAYFESKLSEVIDKYYKNGLYNIDKIQGPSETNDVRYALYKHDEYGWRNVCVQDFDFKDYNDYGFAMPSSDSDPEYDAFQIFVTRVAFIDGKYISEYDDLAEELMDIFVNHKKNIHK